MLLTADDGAAEGTPPNDGGGEGTSVAPVRADKPVFTIKPLERLGSKESPKPRHVVAAFVYGDGEEALSGENSYDTYTHGTRTRRQERVAGDFTADVALLTL